MVARAVGGDTAEQRVVMAFSQHQMAVDPTAARRQLRERHAGLERNARLLRQHLDRAERPDAREKDLEDGADLGRLCLVK